MIYFNANIEHKGERMNENSSDKNKVVEDAWSQRKASSQLPSSVHSMDDKRKTVIRMSLEFDIIDIRSYVGYKGDPLIEITTMHSEVAKAIKNIIEKLELDVVIQKDLLNVYKIFCISESSDTYDLKTDL